jgi:uncharacterized membrane protein YfcA
MPDWLVALLPPDIPAWIVVGLLITSMVTSFITAAFGIGGGVALLAVMATAIPASVVIPLHGVIQIGSNAGRTALMWRHIRWPVWLAFAAGAVIGIALGASLLVELPQGWLELALGAFILWSCWGPMPRLQQGSNLRLALGGAVTSVLTLFVGATGPFVGALLRAMHMNRLHHVGTFSACMVTQHGLKILVFGLVGFAYAPYLPFLAAMIGFGFIGTWVGRQVLERMNDALFRRVLSVLLTLLALRLLQAGATQLLSG